MGSTFLLPLTHLHATFLLQVVCRQTWLESERNTVQGAFHVVYVVLNGLAAQVTFDCLIAEKLAHRRVCEGS